ncbi:MAG: VWA domain-containing protein [Acidobacteria bacterium]|nr:VWA domain-containing protein [Acidobacteriota bacterium]
MKKTAAVLIFFSAFIFTASAQTGSRSSRPRVVTAAPSPTPQTAAQQGGAKLPPVLKGGTNSTQTQTNTGATDANVAEDDGEIIRVETNLVTIPVSVLDRDGRFVSGLGKQDFKIFENGVEQKIDNFAATEQPFTVVLLLDVSPSTAYKINEIHDAAISFVNQLRRDDKVIVIAFDQQVRVLSRATSDRNVLRRAIEEAQFGEGTSLYEAVDNSIRQQLRQIEGRKAVVLFTDGVDTTSRRASYQSTILETQETDVLFYPIRYDTYRDNGGSINYPTNNPYPSRRRSGGGILADILGGILTGGNVTIGGYPRGGGNVGGSRADYETGRRYLQELARNSGGRMFEANQNSNLDAAFSGIAEELRRQYSLGYYPETVSKAGERKQIKVRVMRPNLAVRAKDSYIVGKS